MKHLVSSRACAFYRTYSHPGLPWPCSLLFSYLPPIASAAPAPIVITGADRRPAHFAQWRLGLHRRSLLLRPLQFSSRRKEGRLVPQLQSQARRFLSHRLRFCHGRPNSKCPPTGTRSATRSSTMRAPSGTSTTSITSPGSTRASIFTSARPTIVPGSGSTEEKGLRARRRIHQLQLRRHRRCPCWREFCCGRGR